MKMNKLIEDFQRYIKENNIVVTEEVIIKYFSDLFEYEMETEEDMEELNKAEAYINNLYHIERR